MDLSFIEEAIQSKRALNRYRQRVNVENLFDNQIRVGDKIFLNFSSNDYLGLAADRSLHQAFAQGIELFGTSSVSSSLITGYHSAHKTLEESLCCWLNLPNALLFSSGFAANTGVLQAIEQTGSRFLLDKLAHASLIDGARHNKHGFSRFQHNDLEQLNKKLQSDSTMPTMIVTESVFSMDGDIAPLVDMQKSAEKHNALLYVDDAHGLGVLGAQGQGAMSQLKANSNTLVMGTFGKALATSGAFVAACDQIVDYLVNECRHYIYSTAIAPSIAWATHKAIELIQQQNWRRVRLQESVDLLKKHLADEIKLTPSQTSIIGIVVGDEKRALGMAKSLQNHGFWLVAIRPPTVPKGECRLRVTINSAHKDNEIIALAKAINEEYKKCH